MKQFLPQSELAYVHHLMFLSLVICLLLLGPHISHIVLVVLEPHLGKHTKNNTINLTDAFKYTVIINHRM